MANDIISIKNNCAEFASSEKNIEVLRNANGENHYKVIAKIVGLHPTKVSGLLKKAEKLGLATRTRHGFYKKVSGTLQYMPKINKIRTAGKNLSDLLDKLPVRKLSNKKTQPLSNIPIPSRVATEANKMYKAYGQLYIVENSLRSLIRKVLSPDQNWWKTRVPSDVQSKVKDLIAKAPYHAVTRSDELEYTHLGQLKEIIIFKRNWRDFVPYLNEKDKSDFDATVKKAIPQRNAIGHCIPMTTADLKISDVRFYDILKMIKN